MRLEDARIWSARVENQGLHDFAIGTRRFEVKTSTLPTAEIHVFDERQMHHRDGLNMLMVKIDICDDGEAIDDVAREIIQSIDSDEEKSYFIEKLDETGCTGDRFNGDRFTIISRHWWESNEPGSPFIQEKNWHNQKYTACMVRAKPKPLD